ncbi:hypothetical protein [Leptolyngbya sp. PCC 6406]|uniref:hypothetical protein n=1 Tax=Leptolyngbya sp. PCC 6406 TaxID=1173264 RepID=UPI0002AC4E92|nr:hypothetical protein [Leptolyngbya sp. PCC 6406]
MVERPIKKSERAPGTGDEPKREARRESGDKDRKGGRGKGRDREEVKRGVSPALMRGPKPQPIKEEEPAPEVIAPEETTTEAVTEEVATEEAATEEAATEEAVAKD